MVKSYNKEDLYNTLGCPRASPSPSLSTPHFKSYSGFWSLISSAFADFRILLVEADDSTRQIITALLRKCSYKVAAVSDGLKAWEVLKGRSHNIDLILTEVELPSISGFALLTLIMEHQVCKNIPVIMMSAHDSVSTVYKCMLKGAADFLVKPVRKNELKNLWQHVWRRQSSTTGGNASQDELQKVEATAENNNATSNHSSGYMACIEIGSDTQSSCTKPDMGSDEPPMEQVMDAVSGKEKKVVREAIDLIGSFDSYPKTSCRSLSNNGTNKVDHPSPVLELSLTRSHPSISVHKFSNDRHRLKQSDVSAFSRCVNKTKPPPKAGSLSNSSSDRQLSKSPVGYISDTHSTPVGSSQHNMISLQGQVESQSQNPLKERVFPVPFPARGSRLENPCGTYGSVLPPPFCLQLGLSRVHSPCSSGHHEPNFQTNPYYIPNPEARNESPELHNTTEALEDHSASSSLCNGETLARLNSVGSRSNGNYTHQSSQREAALNKFRMKRKDRCFDKKVRYESRKKLAEQRPRVKGQFVRWGQTNHPDTELTTMA
ncbi:hypothetical protein L1987_15398 [Smallanthus sonchifolius]|uniref:Uncharacterized protein n=1 Tax=Smallanthus sonchifolius TaxID=185202 RepID=A0ACB9J6A3_9ASTR|nr:hypothetical protein L1987_15398 [Smallanthus sonchifolius]